MSPHNWIMGSNGWPIDPKANPDCPVCNGIGVIVVYPPPSGCQDCCIECPGCITNRCQHCIDLANACNIITKRIN